MPKTYTKEEYDLIFQLSRENRSFVEIASIMKEKYPHNWSAKNASRTVANILNNKASDKDEVKTLDQMSREERFRFIETKLQNTPRFKITFKNFDPEEKNLFVEEYLSIIKSTDTLTEVEEQSLFAGILELILAIQALSRKEREEKLFERSMSGEIKEGNPSFRKFVDDRYQKEYEGHMKLYQKSMEGLKMSRTQRLKEVHSQKQTLIELSEDLSLRNAQSEVADEITRLSKLKDEELKRMIDNDYIHGIFEEYS